MGEAHRHGYDEPILLAANFAGDFPAWLPTLFAVGIQGAASPANLVDRRGECVYAGCPHYRKCFIERSARASAQADLVIANHALVMVNAARGRDHAARPTRIAPPRIDHIFLTAEDFFGLTKPHAVLSVRGGEAMPVGAPIPMTIPQGARPSEPAAPPAPPSPFERGPELTETR